MGAVRGVIKSGTREKGMKRKETARVGEKS